MEALLNRLKELHPQLQFTAGNSFSWSPEAKVIYYDESKHGPRARWSLLHETSHALLGHNSYQADYELIRLEVAAWEKAKELATTLGIKISGDHIQDCLDTYRDWLYHRSICPECGTKSMQQDDYVHYRCFNCHTTWRVTPSRFARSYRRSKNVHQPDLVFHLDI